MEAARRCDGDSFPLDSYERTHKTKGQCKDEQRNVKTGPFTLIERRSDRHVTGPARLGLPKK